MRAVVSCVVTYPDYVVFEFSDCGSYRIIAKPEEALSVRRGDTIEYDEDWDSSGLRLSFGQFKGKVTDLQQGGDQDLG